MTDNYAKIVQDNLKKLYSDLPRDLDQRLAAGREGDHFLFDAFGDPCVIAPDRITLNGKNASSILGILISLYALHAATDICLPAPFRAFKEFNGSMPYAGAFVTHTEQLLVPHVMAMKNNLEKISSALKGENPPADTPGDIAFVVYPLPKIALCYILYEADEDFPAAVTCLYSSNADRFMPMDGLADVGEYTSKKIMDLVS
ncbi:MAG TPA: DUF3786 domain-containing protein [Desulfotignum sp.]|nr:DUF3786 domain-containing protein [Desulfotignum sp.]